MTTTKTTPDSVFRALKSLRKADRNVVLARIARDRALREDLIDLAIIAERRHEPSRPFEEFLAERQK